MCLYKALTKVTTVKSIITLGTTDEYGIHNLSFNESLIEYPISPYGFSKFCGTKLAQFFNRCFDLPIVILRPTIAYGPFQANDMFIPSLINSLILNRDFEMTEGNQLRDFIYISDFIRGLLDVFVNYGQGEAVNIASGKSVSLKQVVKEICDIQNIPFDKVIFDETKPQMLPVRLISIKKIENSIKFCPKVSLHQGLRTTIEWYAQNK